MYQLVGKIGDSAVSTKSFCSKNLSIEIFSWFRRLWNILFLFEMWWESWYSSPSSNPYSNFPKYSYLFQLSWNIQLHVAFHKKVLSIFYTHCYLNVLLMFIRNTLFVLIIFMTILIYVHFFVYMQEYTFSFDHSYFWDTKTVSMQSII